MMDETTVTKTDGANLADPATNPAPVTRDAVGNLLDPNDRTAPVATGGTVAAAAPGESRRSPNPVTIKAQNTVTSLVAGKFIRKGGDGTPVLTLLATGPDGKPVQRQIPLEDFAGITVNMVQKAEESLDPLAGQRRQLSGVLGKLKAEGLTDAQIAELLAAVAPATKPEADTDPVLSAPAAKPDKTPGK